MVTSTPRLSELVEKHAADEEPFELRREIGLTRAMLEMLVAKVDSEEMDINRAAPAINQLLNTTGKLVDKLHQIEVGRRYLIRIDLVQQTIQSILAVVIDHVEDPGARALIADQVSALTLDTPATLSVSDTKLTPREESTVEVSSKVVAQEP